ncbi:MAG: TraB/GumN family protein [Pseudomonadota bacterium]
MQSINFQKSFLLVGLTAVLVMLLGAQMSNASQKVHTPVVEEIGELSDKELLKLQEELSKPIKESGRFTEGVLWKIEKDKEFIGYIFGTIHMNDKRVNEVRKSIIGRFDEMTSFAMESFPSDHYWNPYHGGQMIKGDMTLPRGQTLEGLIGKDLYVRVEDVLLDLGLDKQTIMHLKPWAAMRSFAVKAENTEDMILDYELLDRAAAQRKDLYQVESIEEFLVTFYAMPQDVQIKLLEFTLDSYKDMRDTINVMLEAYLEEDLKKMYQVSTSFIPNKPEFEKYRETYLKHVVKDRNVVMEHYMRKPMREKKTFIAIGALHLYGDQGVLALMEKDGYQVTRIPVHEKKAAAENL